MTTTPWLSIEDVAARYQVPVQTVREWRKRRNGPPFAKVGKHLRVAPEALAAWELQHFKTSN